MNPHCVVQPPGLHVSTDLNAVACESCPVVLGVLSNRDLFRNLSLKGEQKQYVWDLTLPRWIRTNQ